MNDEQGILVGGADGAVFLEPRYANRHGLIAGATGTGKTKTLQGLAEGFSDLGVPVFMADVKGDLAGLARAGEPHEKVAQRAAKIGMDDFDYRAYPVTFWDVFGEQGFPVRATISDMGPQLLARLLRLNEVQEGILTLAFEFADDNGMLMLDLADLQTTLQYLGDNRAGLEGAYARISKASIGAILRRLLILEREGGEAFFGEPALDYHDLMTRTPDGRGMINILAADTLIRKPQIYTTFLLWLLSELFESLPEVGDPDKPEFVFFFDEAHLLFRNAPAVFLELIEQVVRLVRSKGVGVYFISQSPADIPDSILGQLGNRVQHALRAYTPRERKAVRVAAQSFRPNPELDTGQVITELGVGEALVSMLTDGGVPTVVQRTLIRPPRSFMGPIAELDRLALQEASPLAGRYDQPVDRESAHELLERRAARAAEEAARHKAEGKAGRGRRRQSPTESFATSVARTLGTGIGREIVRGILGSLFKGRR